MSRLRTKAALIGTAWLSSARVVKCYIYFNNERNPYNKFRIIINFEDTKIYLRNFLFF